MKYHALFVSFEKKQQHLNCCLLQSLGGALKVKLNVQSHPILKSFFQFRAVVWCVFFHFHLFIFIFNLSRTYCQQMVKTLISHSAIYGVWFESTLFA